MYHALLTSTLSLWPPKHPLTPAAFAAFVKGMLLALPSSHDAPSPASNALGELLIDTVWSIDSQLDDIIADSKAAISAQSEKESEKEHADSRVEESGAVLSRDVATKDKVSLLEVVKLLLVRQPFSVRSHKGGDLTTFLPLHVEGRCFEPKPLQGATRHVPCCWCRPRLGQAIL